MDPDPKSSNDRPPQWTRASQRRSDKSPRSAGQRARLSEEARGLLADGMTSRQYLDLLVERQLHADAVQFLAHALPKREAVWWACLCAAEVLGPEPPPAAAAALEAARAWVIDPRDEKRRATFPAAEAAGLGTPAGCAAAAAYFSGGSLAPANLPVVAPAEHLTAHMVAQRAGARRRDQGAGEGRREARVVPPDRAGGRLRSARLARGRQGNDREGTIAGRSVRPPGARRDSG